MIGALWKRGPRARVDSLRCGTVGQAIDGEWYCLKRKAKNIVYVKNVRTGKTTSFATCAEWAVLPQHLPQRRTS